jgi:hypothetical protein
MSHWVGGGYEGYHWGDMKGLIGGRGGGIRFVSLGGGGGG